MTYRVLTRQNTVQTATFTQHTLEQSVVEITLCSIVLAFYLFEIILPGHFLDGQIAIQIIFSNSNSFTFSQLFLI